MDALTDILARAEKTGDAILHAAGLEPSSPEAAAPPAEPATQPFDPGHPLVALEREVATSQPESLLFKALETEVAATATQNVTSAANAFLERAAAAHSAVAVVMKQLGLEHPTLTSIWTAKEVERLLHMLADGADRPVRLGAQTLTGGLSSKSEAL